jgi:perosamine synthetase
MINVAEPAIGKEELKNVIKCIKSGWISSKGNFIEEFEKKFSRYCNCKYGIATNNGTAALHLALKALDIGIGDEVIVPTLTYVATVNAVLYCNAKPVLVDSEPFTWNIDPEKIEENITKKTKCILVVHLYGHPCDMDPILEIARKHDLYVIEDAAEAHGAKYKGKIVGSFGDVACFSFYGNKIITTGEGGMCVTNNDELAEKMRILRNHGMDPIRRYWHRYIGFNYRMTNIQAAIGVAQLKKLNKLINLRRRNARIYSTFLKNINGVTLPPEAKWAKNVYWMYSILIEKEFGMRRDEVIKKLYAKNIETRPFFYPIHTMPPYINLAKKRFPVAEKISEKGINLPSSSMLKKQTIRYICEEIAKLQKS